MADKRVDEPEEAGRFMICIYCINLLGIPKGVEVRRVKCPICHGKQDVRDPGN